jgi:hypothetical protein
MAHLVLNVAAASAAAAGVLHIPIPAINIARLAKRMKLILALAISCPPHRI